MVLFKENRERVGKMMMAEGAKDNSIMLLKGGVDHHVHNSDIDYVFAQESNFQYCFGVPEPDCYGIVTMDGKGYLFIPRLNPAYQVIMGEIMPPSFFKERNEVDECYFVDEIPKIVEKLNPSTIYTINNVNRDSGLPSDPATFEGIDKYTVEKDLLGYVLDECRLCKSPKEIEVMRYIIGVTGRAHMRVMKTVKPGMMEYQLEATFLYDAYFNGGARCTSFTPICGSGKNSSILHYGHAGAPNSKQINDGDLVLNDMGAEYCCYDGDITTTFPANGKFSPLQKSLYEIVLATNRGVMEKLKPGVDWKDMHALANRIILEGLLKLGIVKGDVDEMMKVHLGALFMPHGLGHCLGLDTHDVGGYEKGKTRLPHPGYNRLRCGRLLKEGMIVTDEPGIYFNKFVFEPAYEDPALGKFLVKEKIEELYNFGGIRIEDDVLITKDGHENLSAFIPRTVEEIENYMKQ